MAPQITAWESLAFYHEDVDEASDVPYTTFAVVDGDDKASFEKLDLPVRDITFQQLIFTLDTFRSNTYYIKRPDLGLYKVFQVHNVLSLISKGLFEEAQSMEQISKQPNPHIVRYHGCQARRVRITGFVLDRHANTLTDYLENKIGSVDKEPFTQALTLAIDHLHSLGFAHNDLHPGNILVSEQRMPVLIDFGSSREVGAKLGTSRGTQAWIEGEMGDYHTSDKGHDLFALEKIHMWLDPSTFDY